jgi:hypothetical protein
MDAELLRKIDTLRTFQNSLAASFNKLAASCNSLAIRIKPILKMAEHANIVLTPSEDCKSGDPHYNKYCSLMSALGFSHENKPLFMEITDCINFAFDFAGNTESSAYEPLKDFLCSMGLHPQIIGSGTGLPNGLLYNVDIYTLKPRRSVSSDVLREKHIEPKLIFQLRGRTDLVVLTHENAPMSNMYIKYYIEVKTVMDFNDETAMREAILQLIGGNIAARYHSPPVLLTDLNSKNFVLNIIHNVHYDHDVLVFALNVTKFNTFGEALQYVESLTVEIMSVTQDFARMPTPRVSISSCSNDMDYGKNTLIDTGEEDFDDDIEF